MECDRRVGAVTQLVGLVLILAFVIQHLSTLFRDHSVLMKVVFLTGVAALGVQHVLMLLSAFPVLSEMAFSRNIVIAYLHLVLLGFVTVWIFYQLMALQLIKVYSISRIGYVLFFLAFLATEFILVFQGMLRLATYWLYVFAIVQLSGIALITASIKKT